jgi:exonuclease SbcD
LKIVHTSDWHAGRVFKREPRLPELAAVLENLGDALEREKVDLLLMSGDVFDSGAPVAEAERLVFSFFKRVGRAGIRTVVIAGNHDSPARVEAWGGLTELVGVHTVARPRAADRGGLVTIEIRGETALVAAVPFAAPRDLVSALQMAEDDTLAKQRYAEGMRAIVENVTAPFRADTVNLLMLHTHLEGAAFSGSERSVHLGEEWAATPQVLPPTAHYVALGHIHKPQKIAAAGATALYAGSPLQMDFGEAGEEKSFVLVDARPRQPARWERVPYRGGCPLARFQLTLSEIERDAGRLTQAGWLWVTVPLEVPDPDINAKVRKLLPNVLRVEVELPEAIDEPKPEVARLSMDQAQLFEAYHQERHGVAPGPEILEVFKALYAEEHQD